MKEHKNKHLKVGNKQLIDLYYTALMVFLVFTFANDLLQGIIANFRLEYVLYVIFWLALVVQTTFAYKHIVEIEEEKYNVLVLLSDCLDIAIEIFVCVIIGRTYDEKGYCELLDYTYLSIPFLILSINQTCWYIGVREYNARALTRLIILFVGMLVVTISEWIDHSIWNLVAFVVVHALAMVLLRAKDEAHKLFIERRVAKKSKRRKKKGMKHEDDNKDDDKDKNKDKDTNPDDKK